MLSSSVFGREIRRHLSNICSHAWLTMHALAPLPSLAGKRRFLGAHKQGLPESSIPLWALDGQSCKMLLLCF